MKMVTMVIKLIWLNIILSIEKGSLVISIVALVVKLNELKHCWIMKNRCKA